VIQWLAKDFTYTAIRVVGLVLLFGFLFLSRAYAFSLVGALCYVLISVLVSSLIVGLQLAERFPRLNRYHFSSAGRFGQTAVLSNDEWAVRKADYVESGLRGWQVLFTSSEDGLICVPVLLAGINPFTAVLGGLVFGLLHLGRFTYLECIGKAIIYGLACLLILPHGVLTVVVGHFSMDVFGLMLLKLARRKLKAR
jgi:hypothetical protein